MSLAVKMLLRTPTTYATVLKFGFQFCIQFLPPTNAHHGRQQTAAQVLGSLLPHETSRLFLVLGCGLDHIRHLGYEPADKNTP